MIRSSSLYASLSPRYGYWLKVRLPSAISASQPNTSSISLTLTSRPDKPYITLTTSAVTSSGTTSGALSSDTGTTSGMIAGTTNGAENGTSGGTQNGADANAMNPEDAKIMYNSALYSGTKEEIRTDELGRELITVKLVDSTPQANGEASGVAENTKLYAIRDINDYSAIAFNCGGVYYRATKEA